MSALHLLVHYDKLHTSHALLQSYIDTLQQRARIGIELSTLTYMLRNMSSPPCLRLWNAICEMNRCVDVYVDTVGDQGVFVFLQLVKHRLLPRFTTQLCNQLIKFPILFSVLCRCRLPLDMYCVANMFVHVHQHTTEAKCLRQIIQDNMYLDVDVWVRGYLWYMTLSHRCCPRPVSYTLLFAKELQSVKETIVTSCGLHQGPHEHVCRLFGV